MVRCPYINSVDHQEKAMKKGKKKERRREEEKI